MFIIFVQYSTRPICDVSMNLFCWPPSVDIFNILPGFLWQPLLKPQTRISLHKSPTSLTLALYFPAAGL